jgi:hypothetical protein
MAKKADTTILKRVIYTSPNGFGTVSAVDGSPTANSVSYPNKSRAADDLLLDIADELDRIRPKARAMEALISLLSELSCENPTDSTISQCDSFIKAWSAMKDRAELAEFKLEGPHRLKLINPENHDIVQQAWRKTQDSADLTVRKRYDEILQRLNQHDTARRSISAELIALQHLCQHPNKKTSGGRDYSGAYDSVTLCPDCGYCQYAP